MCGDGGYRRRRFLLSAAAVAVAGCQGNAAPPEQSQVATGRPECASGFEIADRTARIETGSVPEVDLVLQNTGQVPIEYDIAVTFEQKTSLGLPEPTGRDRLTGVLQPDATVTRTATDGAYEIENTDEYSLDVSLSCSPATEATPADTSE